MSEDEYKFCSGCSRVKPTCAFAKNLKRYDGLQATCIPCRKKYNHEHYLRNKAVYKSRARNHGNKVRAFVAEEKENPCLDCGRSYPTYVMDFDHVRGKKLFNLNSRTAKDMSIALIKAELAKCELVCANCHRERTYQRRLKIRK